MATPPRPRHVLTWRGSADRAGRGGPAGAALPRLYRLLAAVLIAAPTLSGARAAAPARQGQALPAAVPAHGATIALTATTAGALWAWGLNNSGQLGTGTTVDSSTPVPVRGLPSVVALAAGCMHSLALTSGGTVWAWGLNGSGQLGTGTADGSTTSLTVTGLGAAVSVAAGCLHSLAVGADGTVWAWGRNGNGQLGTGTTADSHVPVPVRGLRGVVAVAAGTGHSLALKADGTVWAWGDNYDGQLGSGLVCDVITGANCASSVPVAVHGLVGVVAIAAGGNHSLALTSGGTVYAWGANDYGQLGNGTTASSAAPVAVSGLSGVTAIAAGGYHSLALTSNGTVYAWGLNGAGQLGTGGLGASLLPQPVPALSGIVAIAAGDQHSLALTSDGRVWAWGRNGNGQLGNGATCASQGGGNCSSAAPVSVSGLRGAVAIAAGGSHSLGLVGPVGQIAPASLDFGAQLVGTSSPTQTVAITNSGGAPLVIASATLTGTAPGDFTIPSSTCAIVPPDGACAITLAFAPTTAGSRAAALVVVANARASPLTITLSGNGIAPPTSTPLPLARARARSTACPAGARALPLGVRLSGRSLAAGGTLTVSVRTARRARVTVALRVAGAAAGRGQAHTKGRREALLYGVVRRGSADARGRFIARLRIAYRPTTPLQGRLTVTAGAGCRAATYSTAVTLQPQRRRSGKRR